ncbi:MAG: helix-turn-helix transcriptional regulator [Clostridia bacterium]|nr:helix-turn-helix transcriptional regulator [Clostridia bacterium]
MKRCYSELYIDDAMHNLGEAFDYAVNACKLDLEIFLELFISTGIAELIERGSVKHISGISGTELVLEILAKAGLSIDNCPVGQTDFGYSEEFRCGSMLAYYQWATGRSFRNIKETMSIEDMYGLYPILQKYKQEKFVDVVENALKDRRKTTNVQLLRKKRGLSQSELANLSGVNLRTLQQYEVGAKDINKASVSSVLALSAVLGCKAEDILEI